MADFFGGIFDSIRSGANDASGFFSSTLGEASLKAGASMLKDKNKTPDFRRVDENFAASSSAQRAPELGYNKSEDFSTTEVEWLRRLERFSGLASSKDAKIGG